MQAGQRPRTAMCMWYTMAAESPASAKPWKLEDFLSCSLKGRLSGIHDIEPHLPRDTRDATAER